MECERLHDSGRYRATLLTTTRGVSLVIESKAAKDQKRALYDNFNDLLLTYPEKASGCEVTFGGGAADTGRPA